MRQAIVLLGVFIGFLLLNNIAFAVGTLDITFGNNGIAIFNFPGRVNAGLNVMAVQSDGKILMAGYSINPLSITSDFSIARLNTNGTLDTEFGSGGYVITDVGFNDKINVLEIQSDGKILVAGETGASSPSQALVRYNSDGSLDNTFGTNGIVFPVVRQFHTITRLFPQADGKIMAIGSSDAFFPAVTNIFVERFLNSGQLDQSFGSGGIFFVNFEREAQLADGTIQSNGKILMLIRTIQRIPGCIPSKGVNCDQTVAVLRRYHSNLTLDKKFRGNNLKINLNTQDTFSHILLESDNSFLIYRSKIKRYSNGFVGSVFPSPFFATALAKSSDGKIASCFSSQGANSIDTNITIFNQNGDVIGNDLNRNWLTSSNDDCKYLLYQSDGKLVVGANLSPTGTNSQFAAMRYATIEQ